MPYGFGTASVPADVDVDAEADADVDALAAAGLAAASPPLTAVATLSVPVAGRFREEFPTRIWYVPAAVVQLLVVVFQYARSCVLTVKLIVCDWPALSVTRW